MRRSSSRLISLLLLIGLCAALPAHAAPGFFAGKDEKPPESAASAVILAYDAGRMVMSFATSVFGAKQDLALILPVPGFITKEQIHVTSGDLFQRLDAYSGLRLSEATDPSPCTPEGVAALTKIPAKAPEGKTVAGVKMLAAFNEGDYDISLLDASQSAGLLDWIKKEDYRLPKGFENFLQPYIDQQNHFVMVKPRLPNGGPNGANPASLKPLQIAFNAPKFALPLRLASLSAPAGSGGEQDLLLFILTKNGRVEAANLRNASLPDGKEVPAFVAKDFDGFARAVFSRAALTDSSTAWLEFSGEALSCAVCAAPPLSAAELRELGALWQEADAGTRIVPLNPEPPGGAPASSGVWLTRLHLKYRPGAVPEDLQLRETLNRKLFQPQFIIRTAWAGDNKGDGKTCLAAPAYKQMLGMRGPKLADTLARLTGWPVEDIRAKMNPANPVPAAPQGNEWWKDMWKK